MFCKGDNACGPCRTGDQTTDTVKVNLLVPDGDKENMTPQPAPNKAELDRRYLEEKKSRAEAEEKERERQRQAEEERLRLEEQRAEEERQRHEEEEAAERQRIREQAEKELEEERARLEEEYNRTKIEFEAEERRRQEAEQQEKRRQEEELARAEKEREQEIQSFLKSAGFTDINEKKKVKTGLLSSGFTYPLHAAVKGNDPKIVDLLLRGGAKRDSTDSKKLTALDLANKLNKKDSHKQAIAALTTFSAE